MTLAQVRAVRKKLKSDKRYRSLIKRTPIDKIKAKQKPGKK